MTALGYVAQFILTLVGYSVGAVLPKPGRLVVPGLQDVPLAALLCAGGLLARPSLGHWPALGTFALGAAVVSVLLSPLRATQEIESRNAPPGTTGKPNAVRRAWTTWSGFASRLGSFQGRLILAFFYFAVLGPFGAIYMALSDPLQKRGPGGGRKGRGVRAAWRARGEQQCTVDEARNQF